MKGCIVGHAFEKPTTSRRAERVAESIKVALGEILNREIQDPALGFVTITGVQITRDLRHAKVHVTCLGEEAVQLASLKCLRRLGKQIRHMMAGRLTLRHVPEIRFYPDTTYEEAQRIEALLAGLNDDGAE
jgi:ribosome-binding factor A